MSGSKTRINGVHVNGVHVNGVPVRKEPPRGEDDESEIEAEISRYVNTVDKLRVAAAKAVAESKELQKEARRTSTASHPNLRVPAGLRNK